MFAVLDRSRDYVVYCQSGRRSAAAAFLFAQQGFRVWLLEGGLWGAEKRD
jgi:rhodanese-related sulfurtransferase